MCEEISKISSQMHMPCDDSHVELNEVYDVMDKSIETSPETFCQENEVKNCPDITKSKMTLVDMDIPVIIKGETIFVEIQQLFAYSGIDIHVKKNSWKYVDNCLRNNNIRVPDAFIKEDAKRTHINLTAFAVLLGEIRSGLTERKATLLADIQNELHKLAARSIQVTSKMSPFQEHIQMSKTKKNYIYQKWLSKTSLRRILCSWLKFAQSHQNQLLTYIDASNFRTRYHPSAGQF